MKDLKPPYEFRRPLLIVNQRYLYIQHSNYLIISNLNDLQKNCTGYKMWVLSLGVLYKAKNLCKQDIFGGYWTTNRDICLNSKSVDNINILDLGTWCIYCYVLEKTTCDALFRTKVSANYYNLIKIIITVFFRKLPFCFWGSSEGPLFFELECFCHFPPTP
jgi:hypothetical protein